MEELDEDGAWLNLLGVVEFATITALVIVPRNK